MLIVHILWASVSRGGGKITEMGNKGDENNPCWPLGNNQLILSLSPAENS